MKYQVKGAIYARKFSPEASWDFTLFTWDPGVDYVKIKEVLLEGEWGSPHEAHALQVLALKAKLSEIRAKNYERQKELEAEIQNFLALSYEEGSAK